MGDRRGRITDDSSGIGNFRSTTGSELGVSFRAVDTVLLPRSGCWMVSAEGRVYSFGDALHHGEPRAQLGNAATVDLEPTKSGSGIFNFSDRPFLGSLGATPPARPVVAVAVPEG